MTLSFDLPCFTATFVAGGAWLRRSHYHPQVFP